MPDIHLVVASDDRASRFWAVAVPRDQSADPVKQLVPGCKVTPLP